MRLDPAEPEMLVAEGVFTTRAAKARFHLPAWALMSTRNLRAWSAPAGVRSVLIAGDRGKDGEASAEVLRARLVAEGVTARVALPPAPWGDWDEWSNRGAGRPAALERGRGRDGAGAPRGRMTLAQALEPDPDDRYPDRCVRGADRNDLNQGSPWRPWSCAGELRFKEPADDGVPQLADTILAAGVVIPPIVRPGRKGEQRFMALDGRRRRFGLLFLAERGEVTEDYEVDCLLAETKAQQVAGIMLPATEHAPVHIADVITAIGKLRKTKLDTGAIAAALGYAELEIKRLEALAAVHPNVLKALRAGKLTLKQVRLFARIGDKKQQAEIAQTALDGYFQDYQLKGLVTRGRVTVDDPRFTLVGLDRYVAAGGRVSSDLFAELPDALLDPEVLTTAWRERVSRWWRICRPRAWRSISATTVTSAPRKASPDCPTSIART